MANPLQKAASVLGPAGAVLSGVGSILNYSSAKKAAKTQHAMNKLKAEKGAWGTEQKRALDTGSLNIARRLAETRQQRRGEGRRDRDYQAGQAGRIATSLKGRKVDPYAKDRTAQFSAAGRVPEAYDPLTGGTPWERALMDAQTQGRAVADRRAGRMGRIVGEKDLALQDREDVSRARRSMAEEKSRSAAKDVDQQAVQDRLAREQTELQYAHGAQQAQLDRDYYPHLAPQYINVSPIGAIGQGMYGAARGMQAFADNQQPSTQPPVWDPRPVSYTHLTLPTILLV